MSVVTHLFLVLFYISVAYGTGTTSAQSFESDESRVINMLLARYEARGKVSRPVLNATDRLQVAFGIRLVHLDIDEREQLMTTSVWNRYQWTDQVLTWRKEDFNGVDRVILPIDKIWSPDIALVNTAITALKEQSSDASVKNDGRVFWAPQRKYSSACLIDVTEYPYDRHTCDMWFQSIANPSGNMNVSVYPGTPVDLDTYLSSYQDAQEWSIISNTSSWHARPRDVGMILMWSRRASLRFSLTIQRRAGFKGMLLIVPCTLLSFLIPLVFCFPPERPDRHSLAMSLFASLTILLFMVNEVAPPSASFVPRLALYYCCNLLVLLLATCCSAVVVNISKRDETRERVPPCVKKVFIKFLGRVLCFEERLQHLSEVRKASRRSRSSSQEQSKCQSPLVVQDVNEVKFCPGESLSCTEPSPNIDHHLLSLVHRKLSNIESQLKQHTDVKEVPDVSVPLDVRMEWRTLSMVLDRLFFIIFFIMVLATLGFFHPRRQASE